MGNNSVSQQGRKLAGPPTLAKVGAGIAALIAVGAIASLEITIIPIGVLAALAAYKLLNLGLVLEGDKLVVKNLFYTKRLNVATSSIDRGRTDLRTRQPSGIHSLPSRMVPVLPDDTTQYNAKILKVTDSSVKDGTYVLDVSFGRTPAAQAELYTKLSTALAEAQGH